MTGYSAMHWELRRKQVLLDRSSKIQNDWRQQVQRLSRASEGELNKLTLYYAKFQLHSRLVTEYLVIYNNSTFIYNFLI